MKLRKVSIEGFRGAPRLVELSLDGKSLCLLGENGKGKSTVVDALEYWSSGRLESYSREGYGLEATINLEHGPPASITCERQGHPTLRRALRGSKADSFEVVGLADADAPLPPPLPILRHRTMAHFMSQSPGEKKRALLEMLGLQELLEFRDALVTAANSAVGEAADAKSRADEERVVLEREAGEEDVVVRAERLRIAAGIGRSPITNEDDLLQLDVAPASANAPAAGRTSAVERLEAAMNGFDAEAITGWNKLLEKKEALEAATLRALVEAGRKALQSWEDPTCPLCLSPQDRSDLEASLATRAGELARVADEFDRGRAQLERTQTAASQLASALGSVVADPPAGGWPDAATLEAAQDEFAALAAAISEARAAGTPVDDAAPRSDLADILPRLRSAAAPADAAPAPLAAMQLERLRGALARTRESGTRRDKEAEVAAAVDRLRALAEERVRATVEAAIGSLGKVTADFYGRLVKNPVYGDVTLNYDEGRKGGIEFSLVYDQRHLVQPPQRVVSESQLNTLGLAFFLARLKVEPMPWRTLILDDVVNSFDADHRMGLASLLADEFADWQVLFFTHDHMYATLSERFMSGWRFWQIVGWTPREGPVFSDGDPLKRLAQRLNAGETAADLGGLARVALERGLSQPLERLGLPIRFDRRQLYSAPEYLDALEQGLAGRGSLLRDLPVIKRMRGQGYLVNIGAHDRPTDPMLSTEDLRQMIDDLEELAAGFVCPDCHRPVWETRKGLSQYQCKCSKLAV